MEKGGGENSKERNTLSSLFLMEETRSLPCTFYCQDVGTWLHLDSGEAWKYGPFLGSSFLATILNYEEKKSKIL